MSHCGHGDSLSAPGSCGSGWVRGVGFGKGEANLCGPDGLVSKEHLEEGTACAKCSRE